MSKKKAGYPEPPKLPKPSEKNAGCKTPQVMKLLEEDPQGPSSVIMAGKSRIPEQLRRREPLSKIIKRDLGEELGEQFADAQDTVVVNITELAIEYSAPEILDRFNACSCDKCVEEFSRKIAEKVPARYARVNRFTKRTPTRELKDRVEPMRRIVIPEMIRELICNKKRSFHD